MIPLEKWKELQERVYSKLKSDLPHYKNGEITEEELMKKLDQLYRQFLKENS